MDQPGLIMNIAPRQPANPIVGNSAGTRKVGRQKGLASSDSAAAAKFNNA